MSTRYRNSLLQLNQITLLFLRKWIFTIFSKYSNILNSICFMLTIFQDSVLWCVSDVNFAKWEEDPVTGNKMRINHLTAPVTAVGSKTCQVTETQVCLYTNSSITVRCFICYRPRMKCFMAFPLQLYGIEWNWLSWFLLFIYEYIEKLSK